MHLARRCLAALAACVLGITVLSAQGVDRTVERSVSDYFKNYTSPRTLLRHSGLDKRRNKIVVNKKNRKVTIYANEAFAGQAFTPGVVDTIYRDIRALLPSKLRKYKLEVVYDGRTIDERIPNIYKKKGVDKERLWGNIGYGGEPWVRNVSRPFQVPSGLAGRHLALWQSHGRVYSNDKGKWQWQRPSLFCTTEDLLTQSFVVPLLMPMLENAGALVYTPRERDWQPHCVIVDNDGNAPGSRYSEKDGRSLKWKEYAQGYANAKEVYHDKENPFAMGTSRYVTSISGDKRNRAEAVWYPSVPEDGHYAVYVSYTSFENSVPDALYTVVHSGGATEFRVNQRMGGGTWVYLGTFHFKEGAGKEQKVVLCNDSRHSGIVSADAVRFGGGMGNVARGEASTSGLPRYLEAARYSLQTGGFPYEVYSFYEGENDYRDDILCRAHAVNYLSGGSVFNPDTTGLGVPLELSFGFHSDAGYDSDDNIIGSLGIATTRFNGDTLSTGRSRAMSRDAISFLLNNVQDDLTARYGSRWPVRGILDRNYGETRVPYIPSVILESLSHQNFADMIYAHNPDFKFTLARSVYKSLLKHLCYVHGTDYVVQPLPVSHFSMSMTGNDEVTLKWRPVFDPQEPSAAPQRYVVYTRNDDGGFDNGTVVDRNSMTLEVKKGVLYGFKVTALNDGGESLPSEVLSLYLAPKEKGRVLVVNGFHRLSGPATSSTPQTAGFEMEYDPGVPYINTPEYCGVQLDFSRAGIGFEDGLGLSDDRYEGMLVAGNTFDYPSVHGRALAANGVSFLSCGSEAVMSGAVDLKDYKVVDLILGVEKQGGQGSYLGYNRPYKTFPKELQQKIRSFCNGGGNLFVSGAFLASDMTKTDHDRLFLHDVLRCDYGGTIEDLSENGISGNGGSLFRIPRKVNEECYTVSRPDILVPLDDAFVSFVFDKCRESAGVAYAGKYRVLSTSFPFEAVMGEGERTELMGAIMRFLLKK